MNCEFFPFQLSSSNNSVTDEEQAMGTFLKGLTQFNPYGQIDINYQGENIHAMFNDEGTHIGPVTANFDLKSFRDRRGKVFYVTDLNPTTSSANNAVEPLVVVAWKVDIKDTFGLLHVLSFDEYISGLENRCVLFERLIIILSTYCNYVNIRYFWVHGTTIINNIDASSICNNSVDNQTLNHNFSDIVQLQQSPPSKMPILQQSPEQQPKSNLVPTLLQQPPLNQPSPLQQSPPPVQLLQEHLTEQQFMEEIPDTTVLSSVDTADKTASYQSGLGMLHRQNQRDEEKEEGDLREEKSEDDDGGSFLREDEELQHPAFIYVPQSQLNTEKNLADNAAVVHSSPHNAPLPLQVAGTTFNLSSFHFTVDNTSVSLYNDTRKSRLEYIDFSRPQLYLYMWDRRHAVSLSLKSPVTGRYQTRFYLAMTNLCMPLDEKGETVFEELVLLDILNRLDPYAYVDAVVGVVATGEVKLWQYSLNHLRFNYCDFRRPLKRGEVFWFAKLQQFYSERGLLYLIQRLIPRDLDAPKNRFADNKEYITHYKHNIKTMAKAEENFKKWLVLPGKNKSDKEKSEDLQALFSRTNKGKSSTSNPPAEKTKAQIEQEKYAAKQKAAAEKRKATNQAKKEALVKAQADALEQASADGLALLARPTTSAAATATTSTRAPTGTTLSKGDNLPKAVNNLQVS